MKVCSKCKQSKSKIDFNKNITKRDGLASWCKICDVRYNKAYNIKHKEKRRQSKKRYREKHKVRLLNKRRKAWQEFYRNVHNYFDGKCYICSLEDDCTRLFACHHIDPKTKKYGITTMKDKNWEIETIPELKKCVYLCLICHARIHAGEIDLNYKEKKEKKKMAKIKMLLADTGEEVFFDTEKGKVTQLVEVTRWEERDYEFNEVDASIEEHPLVVLHPKFRNIDIDRYLDAFKGLQEQRKPDGSYECLNAAFGLPKKGLGQSEICKIMGLPVKHWVGKGKEKRVFPTRQEIIELRHKRWNEHKSVGELSNEYNYSKGKIYIATVMYKDSIDEVTAN